MPTHRIYVGRRERTSGKHTQFEFALPITLSIREKSLVMIDVVCVPNSILTVQQDKNDTIYLKARFFSGGGFAIRSPKINPGYYTVETLRAQIESALNFQNKQIPGTYSVGYSARLARYTFVNSSTPNGDKFFIYTEESLQQPVPAGYPDIQPGQLRGAFRQLGMVDGAEISGDQSNAVATARGAPNLQSNTQLFIKSNLGIPATSVGPRGNMSICRRVIMDAPTMGLCIDKHATSWDSIAIPGNTTISTFTMQLCGYDGCPVDLNGAPWSCSISIFRE